VLATPHCPIRAPRRAITCNRGQFPFGTRKLHLFLKESFRATKISSSHLLVVFSEAGTLQTSAGAPYRLPGVISSSIKELLTQLEPLEHENFQHCQTCRTHHINMEPASYYKFNNVILAWQQQKVDA